jgi:phage terminase large subunit GpA-like protein
MDRKGEERTNIMRYLEKCPSCGYEEHLNWRFRFVDVNTDMIESVEIPPSHPAFELKKGETLIDGQWIYYHNRGRMLFRMLLSEFNSQGQFRRPYKFSGKDTVMRRLMLAYNRNRVARKNTPLLSTFGEKAKEELK